MTALLGCLTRAAPAAGARRAAAPRHSAAPRRAPRVPHAPARAQAAKPASGDAAAPPGKAGRMSYKPASYQVIVEDSARALLAAMADGERLLEVEFPPLPASKDGACALRMSGLHSRPGRHGRGCAAQRLGGSCALRVVTGR